MGHKEAAMENIHRIGSHHQVNTRVHEADLQELLDTRHMTHVMTLVDELKRNPGNAKAQQEGHDRFKLMVAALHGFVQTVIDATSNKPPDYLVETRDWTASMLQRL